MQIDKHIFGSYDIRGTVPEYLDNDKVLAIAKAYGTLLVKRGIKKAIVGRDCRLSGEPFQKKVVEGLISTGVDVIDVGMVMTQIMYFAQYLFKAEGGVMITASHNPANFNGFKLAVGYSKTTERKDLEEMIACIENNDFVVADTWGKIETQDVTDQYFSDLLERVKIENNIRVVVDSRNGTAGKYVSDLLGRAGCDVVPINSEVDGRFPNGTPDPTDGQILKELGGKVLMEKADLGICFDGDGDRIGAVNEKGELLWNDILVAIFSQSILEEAGSGKIVFNNLCSQIVPKVIEKNGGEPVMWLTGHSHIKAKMAEVGAIFSGELSGHIFFKDFYGHDDGAYAALKLLQYLSKSDKKLSEICAGFPKFISSPEIKLACTVGKKQEVFAEIAEQVRGDFPDIPRTDVDDMPGNDSIRLDFPDGMMVFRYSQNGPYFTIRFEAQDEATYEERKKYVKKVMKSKPDVKWDGNLGINLEALE